MVITECCGAFPSYLFDPFAIYPQFHRILPGALVRMKRGVSCPPSRDIGGIGRHQRSVPCSGDRRLFVEELAGDGQSWHYITPLPVTIHKGTFSPDSGVVAQ